MVKRFPYFLLLIPCLALAETNEDLTYSQYNSDLSKAEREIDYRKRMLKNNELHLLVPAIGDEKGKRGAAGGRTDEVETIPLVKEERKGESVEKADQALLDEQKKHSDLTQHISVSSGANDNGTATHTAGAANSATAGYNKQTKRYLPPSAKKVEGARVVALQLSGDDFTGITRLFGIPLGTKIKVRLDATASSIQPGFVALQVLEDVVGDKKILHSGSTLFGRPSAIKGSSRLFIRLSRGITPEHVEFNVRGSASDIQNEAGLSGSIISDGKIMERSLDAGVLALGSAAASTLLPSDITATAAQTAADSVITEKRKESAAKLGAPAFIVVAKPQEAYVYIEETF